MARGSDKSAVLAGGDCGLRRMPLNLLRPSQFRHTLSRATAGKNDNPCDKTLGETMAGGPEIQVSRLLDERGVGAFQIRLLVWSILLSLIDGYDIAAIAFAAPHLVASWGIPRSALGPVLSASNIGVLFGSALFGWIGDRYGRKPALIGANLLFGIFTVAAAYSADLTQLFWLRLIAGSRHRRRHSQPGGDLHRIGAAQSARDAADHRRRLRADGRRARRLRQRGSRCRIMAGRSCFRSAASCRS